MSRPTRAVIDPAALRHNAARARELAPHARLMSIVKADAYGHGLLAAADALGNLSDAFGVASVEEAVSLRDAGCTKPVCLLEGVFDAQEFAALDAGSVSVVVHHDAQLEMLEAGAARASLDVWIKLDTGMHRLGFAPPRLTEIHERLRGIAAVRQIRALTHLANADHPQDDTTLEQLRRFDAATADAAIERSAANSAGVMAWPQSHLDWVRPGIMLYGAAPLHGRSAADLGLQPVMQLQSSLMAVKQCSAGDPVGYGGTWVCPEPMPVGVVACGYGDGYPRHVATGAQVLVNGREANIVGRVSMDMITVDLRGHASAVPGAPVELWGESLPVDTVAEWAGTISYELLCGVTARVPRVTKIDGD